MRSTDRVPFKLFLLLITVGVIIRPWGRIYNANRSYYMSLRKPNPNHNPHLTLPYPKWSQNDWHCPPQLWNYCFNLPQCNYELYKRSFVHRCFFPDCDWHALLCFALFVSHFHSVISYYHFLYFNWTAFVRLNKRYVMLLWCIPYHITLTLWTRTENSTWSI